MFRTRLPVPPRIRLEASTACQLRCPSCPTTQGTIRNTIGTGMLRFEEFRRLVDANPRVRQVELSNWGEIFLNPDLLRIMEYAWGRGVALYADNGVNLNTVGDEVLEGLVRFHFRSLKCSIDGASRETYSVYRRQGDFDRVIGNVRRINALKTRYGSPYPALRWQFVVFGHNEHEIPKARALATELGMSFHPKLSWGDAFTGEAFSPVRDREQVRRELPWGVADRDEYHARYGESYGQRRICAQLWKSPQINWDGRLLGCCVNHWGDFGNVFRDGLAEAFNGDRISYARRMLMGREPPRADIPCTTCFHYRSMRAGGRWLTTSDVMRPAPRPFRRLQKAIRRLRGTLRLRSRFR